jgi:hypothetical protein
MVSVARCSAVRDPVTSQCASGKCSLELQTKHVDHTQLRFTYLCLRRLSSAVTSNQIGIFCSMPCAESSQGGEAESAINLKLPDLIFTLGSWRISKHMRQTTNRYSSLFLVSIQCLTNLHYLYFWLCSGWLLPRQIL